MNAARGSRIRDQGERTMSEHRVSLSWHRDRDDFKYPTYTRDHA